MSSFFSARSIYSTSIVNTPTVALVTGANGGIGRAVAESLATDHHYHVIIGSRNLKSGEEVANTLKACGFLASAVQLDLAIDETIHAASVYISDTFGKLDVLVNNAGVHFDMAPNLSIREQWTSTFATNAVGTAVLTDELLPLLRKAEVPRIVFVSSTKGSLQDALDPTSGFYDLTPKAYDASKAAVNMQAISYAKLLKDAGGLVNAVCPGLVDTKIVAYMGEDVLAEHGAAPPELGAKRIVEMATLSLMLSNFQLQQF